MKFTLSWLKEHLETDASLDEILNALDNIGLEVESVENPADKLSPFTVAEVIQDEKHPDADKLKVCKVNTGSEIIQIVCGAPNARAGIKVVLGCPGDYVPGIDVTLKAAEIRGVKSVGMMCSARELELGEDHDGIIELPEDAPVGQKFVDYAKLDDPVIEIAITPNRQDCLGVSGIARDLAAAGIGKVISKEISNISGSYISPISVDIKADPCHAFMGRYIRGVKNSPSPKWLQDKLTAIGLRPISALVDITNLVTFDRGRPLHVFDADKVAGNLLIRPAKQGEKISALNDKSYVMKGDETVIVDDNGIQSLGGIVGGEDTGCSDETTNVFLECAWFEPVPTALTGRLHGIDSDARYRFERGVDPKSLPMGIDLGTQLILDLCGGEASQVISVGEAPKNEKVISFRPERVKDLGGLDLEADVSKNILERLGFIVQGEGPYQVTVPSWRSDVAGEPDLVEEVLRIHGLDNVPSIALPSLGKKAGSTLTVSQKRTRSLKRRMAAAGMMEAVTWSFMSDTVAKLFGGGDEELIVDNPISSELNCMRPSILPNLIEAVQRNADRGSASVALFEVGPQYRDASDKGQDLVAAGVRSGNDSEKHWAQQSAEVSVFNAKADALAALEAVGAPLANLQVFAEAPSCYHPGRSGTLRLGPKNILAAFGEIHPKVLKAMDVDGPIVAFEVFIDNIPKKRSSSASKAALKMSNLQQVERDFAFVVDKDVSAQDLIKAVRGADKKHISNIKVFDVYEGSNMEEGKKSVALNVVLEPKNQTFSDKEITEIVDKIVNSAAKSAGASLR